MYTWNPNKPFSSLIINPNSKKNQTTSSPYKELTLIEPKDISPLNPNTSAFSCFFGGDLVEQRYFQTKGDRKYLVSVLDPSSKQRWKREVPKINFNAITARRLMVEVVDFIEDMVIVGACIDKPLHQFLLVSYEKGKQRIKMMRLPSKNQNQQIIQLDQQTTVEKRWLVMLKKFYMFLFTMIQKQSEISEYTFESINQTKLLEQLNKKSTKMIILKKLLLTYQFKYQQKGYQYLFRCFFNSKEYILQASITNLSRQYSVYFRQEEQIQIKDAKNLNLSAFFYLTSMLPLQKLRINSSEYISFYDQTRSEWVQVRLAKYYPTSPQADHRWLYEQQQYKYSSDMAQYQIEENDVQFRTVRQMRVQGQLSSQYPYNCICLIEAHYKFQKGDMVVRGVGSLITRKLVLTNAHIIFYRNPLNGQRGKPYKINAIFMGKNIKASRWIISPKYFHEQLPHDLRFRRQYDLGLLQLETSPLQDDLPLQLATDYQSEEQILFPKLIKDYKQGVARVELFHSQEEVNIVNRKFFRHQLETQLGDSGTPIIIQRCPQLLPKFLIISIHSSSLQLEGMKQRKRSIKINKQAIDELLYLQKLLYPQLADSQIMLGTSSYKDRPSAQELKNQMEIQQLRKEALEFIKICIMKQYHKRNPKIKWSVSQHQRIFSAAKFMQYCKKKQPSQTVNTLKTALFSLLYFQNYQRTQEGLHPVDSTLKHFRQFQQTTDEVMKMDLLFFYYRYKLLKLRGGQPQIPQQLRDQLKLIKLAFYLHSFDYKFIDKIMKILELKITSEDLKFDKVYYQHIEQIKKMRNLSKSPFQIKEPLLSQGLPLPFTRFLCEGKIQSLKMYAFKYVVSIKQRKDLHNIFWQLLLVEHKNMLIMTPLKFMTQNKELSYLEVGFWAMYNTTIQSALLNKIMPIGQWLLLMIDVVSFVMFLHGRGFILGAPIETCLLINFKHKPVFFYFSHPSILKSSINNSDKRQRLYLHEYYPFLQISKAGNSLQSFKQIDVWMLGLSFSRIFHRLFTNPKQNWSNGKEIVEDVIGQLLKRMKCPVQQRIHLEKVQEQLENIKDICQDIGEFF